MSENKTSQQLIDILKPLSVEKRIDTIFDLFENPELFKNEEISELSGFLQLASKQDLSTKIDNFLTLLYKLDNLDNDELEKIISDNITLKPSEVNTDKYIEVIKDSLDDFYTSTFDILKDKLLKERSNKTIKPVDTSEKYVRQSRIVKMFGFQTSNINNGQFFKNRRRIEGTTNRYEIPWSDVEFYIESMNRAAYTKEWEKYKSEHQW